MQRHIILIAHNLRSCHNVGSLLRTAEGLGISKVYLTGYTPYPAAPQDKRLPHEQLKITKQIHKTALGAEEQIDWAHEPDIAKVIGHLKDAEYKVVALEQTKNSQQLPDFNTPKKVALVLGREVEGLEPEVISLCDRSVEIPMFGQKESFNVAQAAAMALYHMRFDKS